MEYRHTLPNGTVLHEEFKIERLLGSGGFANTYLAFDQGLLRQVAIKEYFPSSLAVRTGASTVQVKSPSFKKEFDWALDRFVREAKTLAKLKHPNIVRVFSTFNANSTAYIVLEFVEGAEMEAWLKALDRRPSQAELDSLLGSILTALERVHSANILHRDLKPANIYIRADGSPVLLDFGAARHVFGGETGTTTAIVSRGYSPHESYLKDAKQQGPWTDIYGLAATLYRALNGEAPPEATERALEDTIVPAVKLPLKGGEYRIGFLQAIDRGLTVNPKQRPQSIAAWRPTLLLAADTLAPTSEPRTPVRSAGAPFSVASPSTGGLRPPAVSKPKVAASPAVLQFKSAPEPRKRSLVSAALGVVFLLGGGATLFAWQTDQLGQWTNPILSMPVSVNGAGAGPDANATRNEPSDKNVRSESARRKAEAEQTAEAERGKAEAVRIADVERAKAEAVRIAEVERTRQQDEQQREDSKRRQDEDSKRLEVEKRSLDEQRRAEEMRVAALEVQEKARKKQSDESITWQRLDADGPVTAAAISPDGSKLATGGRNGQLQLRSLRDGREIASTQLAGEILTAIALGGEAGDRIATSSRSGGIAFWDTNSKDVQRTESSSVRRVLSLSYNALAREFLSITVSQPTRDERQFKTIVERWIASDGKPRGSFEIATGGAYVTVAVFSPNGESVAVATESDILVWSVGDRKLVSQTPVEPKNWITSLAFSPDGARLALGGRTDTITIWDVSDNASSRAKTAIALRKHASDFEITALAFSRDGQFVAAGSKDEKVSTLTVFDAKTGKTIKDFSGASGRVPWLAFLPSSGDKQAIAAPWSDGAVELMVLTPG